LVRFFNPISRYQNKLVEIIKELETVKCREQYNLEHRASILERELLKYKLLVRLNELELAQQKNANSKTLFTPDQEIATIGQQLNQARIKRRIYDYVAKIHLLVAQGIICTL
jgi:hypothetical protein